MLHYVQVAPDIAIALYWTGLDPFTGKEVYVAKALRDRKMQRALMQFFKPKNDFTVREALLKAGRGDLIGNGCDCLIPEKPPREALAARRARANRDFHDHSHADEIPKVPGPGYRPGRATKGKRDRAR